MASIVIDVFSDAVCPWCYVGKRRLEKALQSLEEQQILNRQDVSVHWHPFELHPHMDEKGIDWAEFRIQKFGSAAVAQRLMSQVVNAAAGEGLTFHFDQIQRLPNTAAAHRLIAFAQQQASETNSQVEDAVVETLFRAYFVEGRNIGELQTLRDVAVSVGLDGDAAIAYIQNPTAIADHQAAEAQARAMGIQGVPLFVINGTQTVSGAQRPETFVGLIQQALNQQQLTDSADGVACAIDGSNC